MSFIFAARRACRRSGKRRLRICRKEARYRAPRREEIHLSTGRLTNNTPWGYTDGVIASDYYAWLFWSLLLLVIWGVIYLFLGKENRREMLVVSAWTALLGFTEPIFVPRYWNPPSLFNLAHRTGFDLESFIFSFAMGGIAVVLYELLFARQHDAMSAMERHDTRHRYHLWALLSAPIIFFGLLIFSPLNPIHSAFLAMMLGGLATWYCRPDLKKKMIVSAFLFLALYFLYFLTLIAAYPGYVERVWNLSAISGVLVFGVPLEELMFAFGLGFLWSSVYEHVTWHKLKY